MIPLPVNTGEQFRHIELEICTACDLACFGCDRMSDVTTAPNMTLGQVRRFVDESLGLSWRWERIRLLGGEPTLHPQFTGMVEELIRYRRSFPCFLQVLTNGRGKAEKYRAFCQERQVSLHAEAKEPGVDPPWFTNTRIAPVDRYPGIGEVPPCNIFGVRGCGIGLTRHGYFLDGAGATIARVLGLDIGVMQLKDLTWDAMIAQSRLLCRFCGHWNLDGELNPKVTETGHVVGAFWAEALERWRRERPKLRVYGDD